MTPLCPRSLLWLLAGLLSACGGGTPEAGSAAGADTKRMPQAASTRLAVAIPATPDPLFDNLVIPADAPTKGLWSGIQTWPMNAIHLALGPEGQVLSYGSLTGRPDVSWGRSFDFWTPSLGFGAASHRTVEVNTLANSFCNAPTLLPDGNLLMVGGVEPKRDSLVRWASSEVVDSPFQMANDRWYPTSVTLADGRVVVVGGMDVNSEGILLDTPDLAIANGSVAMTPELYTPGTGWRSLSAAISRPAFGPDQLRASYPKSWVAPSGLVFGISADTMWTLDVNATAGLGATRVVGNFKTPYSATAPVNVGTTATAVMFAPGRILQVGGNGGVAGESLPASNMATVVDINGDAPKLTEQPRLATARRLANTVVLPDGQVLATGGTRYANDIGASAVYTAELWNPATGTWTTGAAAAVERVYHSTTLLLPNGTVLSAGGGAPGPVSNQNAEIYYPPYLFRSVNGVASLAPRPVVTGVNALAFGHGGALQVELASGQVAKRLVLVRTGTVTHAFNNSQRFIELPFTQTGDIVDATLPANPNLAPPGTYQLAVLDAAGVPSKAVLLSLGLSGSTPAPVPALTRGQTYALRSVGSPGLVVGRDAGGQGVVTPVADAAAAPLSSQFIVRNGLADAACVSLESRAAPGSWLRQANLRVGVAANDASAGFPASATFCPEQAPGARGLVLRAKSHPGYLLRHRNGEVWLDLEAPDAAFVASSAFEAVAVNATGASNQPPTLALTALLTGTDATAGQPLTLTTNPGDVDGYITKVEFYDGATLIASRTAQPWSASWIGSAGVHTLTARAFDDKGASATSAPVTVTLKAANQSPTLAITAPASGAAAPTGTPLTISTNPADVDGYITRVEFYDGPTLIAAPTAQPWSVTWTGSAGPHTLTARAFDDRGASTLSAAVTVTLTPAAPTPLAIPPASPPPVVAASPQPAPNTPPTVAVTAPSAGATLTAGRAVSIATNPGDANGYIVRVEFYDGTKLIGTRTAQPWSLNWATTVLGPHALTAKAFDDTGAATVSAAVVVTVR